MECHRARGGRPAGRKRSHGPGTHRPGTGVPNAIVGTRGPVRLVADPRLAELWDGIVQSAPDVRPDHTSLADFDRLYFGVGPVNYFWYQGTFAARVTEVFAERGLGFLADVRDAFPVGSAAPLSHTEVLARFEAIHPGFVAWAAALEELGATAAP